MIVDYLTAQALHEIAEGPEYARGVIPDFDGADVVMLSPGESRHNYLPPAGASRLPEEHQD